MCHESEGPLLCVPFALFQYMSLSINCLRMLNDDLLYGYRTDLLKKSVSSCWTEREVGYLATLIRTVDRQLETGNSAGKWNILILSRITRNASFIDVLLARRSGACGRRNVAEEGLTSFAES